MRTEIQARHAHALILCAVLLAMVPLWASAQTFRGTILGTVTDQTGAVVPGVKVTVKNVATGLTRNTETTADGSYALPELPIGTYTVTVEKAGFQTSVVTGVRVDVAVERRVDATLKPGEVAQRVEVSGEALPLVESTSNVLGAVIEPSQVLNLPVNARDFQKLIYMVPGIAGSPDQITDSPGSFGVFSMNGARGRANNFLLDGTDMNDGYRNDPAINEAGVFGTPATLLPIEAIAELHVLSNYEAAYGRNAGAVINTVTKSGTNEWHGTAFNYFRNDALGARNFFNQKPDPRNPFHNDQFGAALGGPIVRDKTFFYLDFEGWRETGTQASASCVPRPALLATATNPVILNLLALKPWPTPSASGAGCAGSSVVAGLSDGQVTTANTPFKNNVDNAIVKIDHNITKDHLLSGRYYFGDSVQSFPLALVGGGVLPQFNTFTPTRVQLVSISLVSRGSQFHRVAREQLKILAVASDGVRRHLRQRTAPLLLDLLGSICVAQQWIVEPRGPFSALRLHPGRRHIRRHPNVRPIALGDALLDDRNQLVVHGLSPAHWNVQPALDARAHQVLGIRQRDVVNTDGHVVLQRLGDNRAIENGRERLLGCPAAVHPNLDERGLHQDVVVHSRARFLDGRDGIGHVHPGRVALRAGAREGDPRSCRSKQRRIRDDLIPHAQWHVAPVRPAAVQVGAVEQVADADRRADSVVGEALQMVGEILDRVELLGHGPFRDVLESVVAVEINQRRHDGLARQINMRRASGNL
jgi:hypothetical protein